jgi:toxin ParE1/3/4
MHSISFTVPAQEDISSLHYYIAADDPAAASRLVLRVRDVCDNLRDFAEIGRLREDLPTSRLIACKPNSIFYEIQDHHIEIIRVIHMSMDVESSRLE